MGIYLNALEKCYTTLKQKTLKRYGKAVNYNDWSYFAMHCPFAKMV